MFTDVGSEHVAVKIVIFFLGFRWRGGPIIGYKIIFIFDFVIIFNTAFEETDIDAYSVFKITQRIKQFIAIQYTYKYRLSKNNNYLYI